MAAMRRRSGCCSASRSLARLRTGSPWPGRPEARKMRRLAAAIARWVVRYFLTFVFIVAVLIGAKLLVKEFDEYRRAQAELAALESGRQQVGAHLARLQSSLAARVAKLQKAPLDQLAA